MGVLNRIKEIIVNKLVEGIILNSLHTLKLVDKGNTLYVDIADFDHNTADGSPTESQMWYNVTDHVLRYRNDIETVDIGGASLEDFYDYESSLIAWGYRLSLNSLSWNYDDYQQWSSSNVNSPTPTLRSYFRMIGKGGHAFYGRIYNTDVAVGTERSTIADAWFTEDIAGWSIGDDYELWLHDGGESSGGAAECKLKGIPLHLFSNGNDYTV